MISITDRAKTLTEALPYIQKFYNKTVVIKYGGNAMLNDELKDAVMTDIVLLSLVNVNVVLVHGGGPEINTMLDKVGKKSQFIDGLRYTDEETMDIVNMVLCGKVNKGLVQLIQNHGGKAVGLSGIDGGMISAKQLAPEYGLVGEITNINVEPINNAIKSGYIPVIATIGGGENGEIFNINADTVAGRIASELQAEKLILMTDIVGVLSDINDQTSLIHKIRTREITKLKLSGVITGGMIPKIDCCEEAIRRGVDRTHIIDGRIPHSILIEMLTNEGVGTMLSKE